MSATARRARRAKDEFAKSLFNVAVGRAVRTLREAAGMSQATLGAAAGMSHTALVNIECGATALPLFWASSITEVLDCTLDDLVPVMLDAPEEP